MNIFNHFCIWWNLQGQTQ